MRLLSLCEMHYEINRTKTPCDKSGTGEEKSDGIIANMNHIRLRSSTLIPSNSLKSGSGMPALLYFFDSLSVFLTF